MLAGLFSRFLSIVRYCVPGTIRAGPAKAVAVELAARLAGMSGRAIGLHYGIGAAAVGAIHRRLADRPDVLQVVESLTQQLRKTRTKLTV